MADSGSDPGIPGAVVGLKNMWELTELEREKRPAERVASIEAIVSGLIHENRNPLVGIRPEFRAMFSRTAGHEIRRIDDLPSPLRANSGASQPPMQTGDLSEPLHNTFETLHAQMEDRTIPMRLAQRRGLGIRLSCNRFS